MSATTSEFNIAVHALVFLNRQKQTLSSETLSKNICTNPARVRKIMSRLKKAGLIATKEGMDGGYSFDREAAEVTLLQIADALGVSFVSASWHSGDTDMDCLIASGMAGVMDDIYRGLDELCREALAKITLEGIGLRLLSPQNQVRAVQPTPCGK